MDGLTVTVAVLVLFHVVVLALAPLVSDNDRTAFRRRFHVSMRPVAFGWTAGLVGCVLLAVVGDLPLDGSMGRGEFRAVGLTGLLLVAGVSVGTAGVVGGAIVGRRLYRLRTTTSEPPGEIAATGRATPASGAEPEPSPVFERRAVCWTWTLEAYDRHGGNSGWTTARGGSGGVPLCVRVDERDGAVTIDPAVARVDVPRADSTTRSPDAPAPGRLERVADTDVGGSEHRYSEGTVEPGETVTVVGECAATGRVRDDGGLEPWIAAGDRTAVDRRLRRVAAGYVGGGAICLLIALPGYLSWLGLW